MTVCCREGVLWITRTGTPGDHLLRAGGVFSSDRPGRIVIGALADSAFSVAEGKTAPALSAGVLLQALRRIIRRTAEAGRCLWT
jgi:hypothetical protein